MIKIKKFITLLLILLSYFTNAQPEIKFNLASSLILVPNIGIELPINENLSYQLDTTASFWDSIDGSPYQLFKFSMNLDFTLIKVKEIFLLVLILDTECLQSETQSF